MSASTLAILAVMGWGFGIGVLITTFWHSPRRTPKSRVLLEVPFLSREQLDRVAGAALGASLQVIGRSYWSGEMQPDERLRLVIVCERFDFQRVGELPE